MIEELARRAREAEKKVRQQRSAARQSKMAPIRVRASHLPTFSRYVFELPEPIGVTADNGKDKLALTFGALLKFDLAEAKATLPAMISAIDSEVETEAVVIRFSFASKVDVRTFREDLTYVVDVSSAERKETNQGGVVKPDDLGAFVHELEGRKKTAPAVEAPQTVPARPAAAPAPAAAPRPQPSAAAPKPSSEPVAAERPAAAAKPGDDVPAPRPVAATPVAPAAPTAAAEAAATPAKAQLQPQLQPQTPAPQPQRQAQAQYPAPAPEPRPAAAEPRPAAQAAQADETAAPDDGPQVKVFVTQQGESLTLRLPFGAPTPAAIFRRGDTLWLVFDSESSIVLPNLDKEPTHSIKSAVAARQREVATVRLRLDRPRLISVAAEGATWAVTLGAEMIDQTKPLSISRAVVRSRSSAVIPFEEPADLHRIEDPEAGDTLLVTTALGPARGFPKAQEFVEFRALASSQGVVIQPLADDLDVDLSSNKIVISRPAGLTLSAAAATSREFNSPFRPRVFDSQLWGFDRQADFTDRKSHLIADAAQAPETKRSAARVDLARFFLARDMPQEAKAVLDVAIADTPPTTNDSSCLVLRALANNLIGHPEQALKDLANPVVGSQHDAGLWRGMAYARLGRWTEANEAFHESDLALATLPLEMQRVLMKDMIRAAIGVGDFTGATDRLHDFEAIGIPAEQEPAMSILTGRIAEGLGRINDALRAYQTASASGDRPAEAEGRLREIVLKHSVGNLTRAETVDALETLTTMWRGDDTEAEGLQLLARLYTEDGRYRDAFRIMRAALASHPTSDLTRRIQDEAAASFNSLFLAGKGDALPAIDALALFYDFRELTPIGRRGDEMIRRLADRLVSVDLLDQAAELLQHQVDHRLQGAARAQVATRLAVIYLMNHKADKALATLRATRIAELPNDVRNQRLLLEARALSDVGRHDVALEVIGNIEGREAMRLRSDILWAGKRWRDAAEQIELLYGDRWKEFEPLTDIERSDILRAASGYALGEDALGLVRFRERYVAKMGEGPDQRAFDVITAPIGTGGAEFREIARNIAAVDTLDGFLRERYPGTGAMSPPRPPASPAPTAEAPKTEPAATGAAAPRPDAAGRTAQR